MSKAKKFGTTKNKKLLAPGAGAVTATGLASSSDALTLVMDNGAGRIKYGWATDDYPVGTMPNAMAKIHKTLESVVGDEIDTVPGATSQLRFSRPFDRGYLTNWNVEREIWHRMFSDKLNTNPADCNLVLTVAPFCPDEIQQDTNEVLFEEIGFASALCRSAPWFSSYHYSQSTTPSEEEEEGGPGGAPSQFKECNIVVDSGFSFSHSIPFVNGMVRPHAAKRVNVGGKLLTNYLKEVISYRQWNFMDEFLLVNEVKERLCFVSQDFEADLSRCQRESPNTRIPRHRHPRPGSNSSSSSSSSSSSGSSSSSSRGAQLKEEDGGAARPMEDDDIDDDDDDDDDGGAYACLWVAVHILSLCCFYVR
jgi:actin-related protein 6